MFQISTSVLSRSQCAVRSIRSVLTIKGATCASARKATRRKTASVSKHHSQVRMRTWFTCAPHILFLKIHRQCHQFSLTFFCNFTIILILKENIWHYCYLFMHLLSSEKDEESEESEATAGQHGELWCKKTTKKTDQWERIMKRICSFLKLMTTCT